MNDNNNPSIPSDQPIAARENESFPKPADFPPPTPEAATNPDLNSAPSGGRDWGLTIMYLVSAGVIFTCINQDLLIILPFLVACLTTTIYLFSLALRNVPESLMTQTLEDDHWVFRSGTQGPRSAFRSLCPALGRMVGLHYLCAALFAIGMQFLDSSMRSNITVNHEMLVFFIFLNSTPIAALLMGAMLASSAWVLVYTKFGRVLVLAGLIFGWLVHYWIIFFIVVSLFHIFGVYVFLIVLMLSLILPGLIVSWAWRRAEQKLAKMEQCLK